MSRSAMIEEGMMAEQYGRDRDGDLLEDIDDKGVKVQAPHRDGDGWDRVEYCDRKCKPVLKLAGNDGLRVSGVSSGLISELV